MGHIYRQSRRFKPRADLHEAAGIAGYHDIGAGIRGCEALDLAIEHRPSHPGAKH